MTSKFNCLFDTGSQRPYLSEHVINELSCSESDLAPVEFEIKTFLGSKVKKLNQVTLEIEVNREKKNLSLPVLVDDDFDIEFKFDGYKNV